jgi:hypothetical protein
MADEIAQVNGSFGEAAHSLAPPRCHKLISTSAAKESILNLASFGLAFVIFGVIASAQNAPAEPAPKADAGTTVQAECIDENDGFTMNGKTPVFMIELANKCAQRMSCKVFVYINSAKGPTQGSGTLVLAGKSAGDAAKKTFTMRTKMNGGNSQSTRECKVL